MIQTTYQMAHQAVIDALTLRGPNEAGGFLTTSEPDQYMGAERLRLAREALACLPAGATAADAAAIAEKIEPRIVSAHRRG